MAPRSVYIHIPFCSHKCYYCDFAAYRVDGQPVDEYLSALEKEVNILTQTKPPERIDTIYLGGGTPTILTPLQMKKLLHLIDYAFPNRSKSVEFTIEANPESVTQELLMVLIDGGVNRISFGVQTFHPILLKEIGRIHGRVEVEQSVAWARKVGFDNISLDLMFGLPKQRMSDLEDTLKEAIALKPQHLSCYSLKVEEGTRFYHLQQNNQLLLPTDEEEYEMYQLIRNYLKNQGYQQYEVSNFSLPGYESIHNSVYWKNNEYYGIGVGAHGYIDGHRYANARSVQTYLDHLREERRPLAEEVQMTPEEDMENFMILGLRLLQGVHKRQFANRYGKTIHQVFGPVVESLVKQGLIKEVGETIQLTEKGLLFGNDVFASFLLDAH